MIEVVWPHGDCVPVLATHLSAAELARRVGASTFRQKDDLDWFTGLVIQNTSIGPILVMDHDNNPKQLTAFYVDLGQEILNAQAAIQNIFAMNANEVSWQRDARPQ